jgi:predicted nucleic acid-binding protein
MIRIGFDSNILAYLAGVSRGPADATKIVAARALLATLATKSICIAPTQALGELFVVLTRAGASRDDARDIVLRLREGFNTADTSDAAMVAALDLAATPKLQLWDSVIISAAADTGCALLLTEDMQDGFIWRGVTLPIPLPPHRTGGWRRCWGAERI